MNPPRYTDDPLKNEDIEEALVSLIIRKRAAFHEHAREQGIINAEQEARLNTLCVEDIRARRAAEATP